jgi:dihydrofolate reductase
MASFDIVVAADEAGGIGKASELPWRLPGDTKFLKRITTETNAPNLRNAVVMGRKTFETIPPRFRPLKKRLNVVVTRNDAYEVPDGAIRAGSIAEAVDHAARDASVERIFLLGGGEIYKQAVAMRECRRIYLTRVEGTFDCDAFFPEVPSDFQLIEKSERHEDNGIGYRFLTYERG